MGDTTGNLPPMPGVFPDYLAPIVRNAPDGVREMTKARWGMPSSQLALMQGHQEARDKTQAPVILTKPEDIETWMTAPAEEAVKLHRPLPDRVLEIVARDAKKEETLLEA